MRKYILLIFCAAFLASCSSRRHAGGMKPGKRPDKVITGEKIEKVYSTNGYIERFKGIAVEEMNKNGIPASITLAQGMLESANGNSSLAREANNHFGIKCHAGWQGKTVAMDDDAPGECFRFYNSAEESYRDHSEFLKRQRYAFLFQLDRNDYKGWAQGLKKAGYATNPRYPELLIGLIERYGLDRFDRGETILAKAEREEKVQQQIEIKEKQPEAVKQAEPAKAPLAMKIYEVLAGDTLYSISRKFGLTVDEIKILNSLQGGDIKPGQLLLVSK
ncbi:glucosaminidase domain-containing protein [Pararcticibacter amylolyticus]|uniref:Peptidoglycan hydrolase n=1 Tax=Pararcticibacter amylolyticus TaxID=2173175 RepID=A0A2U2P9Z8_9SPHI|nr:glucosaminidase domain-containing protein [Pararcticibacter amylolyticus]PWG78211.1 hemagglutinin [Pararcticibacter amylolyticus]